MTTTLLQPYSPGQSYVFNGLEIPSQQTLPPAGQESFAFRPACSQLQETSIPGDSTQVSWGMPYNNNFYSFSVKPAGLSTQQAHLYLDAEGNCKINGVEVPLVPATLLPKDLLPESVVTTETVDPAMINVEAPSQGLSTQTMTGLAFILIGLAIAISGLFSQKTTQVASSLGATEGASTSGQDSLTALMELLNSD
ncbi:hypothetical protein N836_34030 [Leptolyngbya sp. Heron Island J]|uniref:hypothetical protein n=1 Tax=Leptolyngbya sp. Heron Island J TaxID=1385935 RepID=UPI0003B9EBEF|nr:hypothetical protein [Leptolyngbya sp. Heron Island J]ESA38098.1 hypothetical protein N836_34030 [Leptolyngbya sp. Heron Island J]